MLAYLPPHCDRPIALGDPPDNRACGLAVPVQELWDELVTQLETQPLGRQQLQTYWNRLESSLRALESCFHHDPERRHAGQTVVWQRTVWADTDERESPEMLENYRIYDAHFGVMRMDRMTWQELAHQCVSTWRRTVQDLPETLLSREHYRALAVAGRDVFEQMFPLAPPVELPEIPSPPPMDPVHDRWRNGHHLFGLCCYFGREALHRATDAVQESRIQGVCDAVYRASSFLAASSAAMVYTGDFPARHYLEEIRPAMPQGFSGTHNSDFNHFKLLKGKLHVALMAQWGRSSADWPQPVQEALEYFRAIDLLDLDHHILLAAARIGFGLSLKQARERAQDTSAIQALRRLAEARKKDFQLPNTSA